MKVLNALIALLFTAVITSAQQPAPTPAKVTVSAHKRACRPVKHPTVSKAPAVPPSSLADFYVGAAKVDVTRDETVVRLAMAQHGSVLIELPANDGPRYIIPGDPEMATVDEKALERNKRAIVVRPGEQFVPPTGNRAARLPTATVTAQMRSGLVVTFLFYPVADLAQNVHRCVLNYSRDEVVARRRKAGLPVDLEGAGDWGDLPAQSAAALSSNSDMTGESKKPAIEALVASASPPLVLETGGDLRKKTAQDISAPLSDTPLENAPPSALAPAISESALTKTKYSTNQQPSVRAVLEQAARQPKQFKNWTKPAHGISLSVVQHNDALAGLNTLVVAVRNKTNEALKLVAGSPELFVETLDEQGKPLNVQLLKTLSTETTEASGVVPANGIIYYAIAYVSPVLDVHQQLKIVVGQTNAADEPAAVMLANGGR